MKSFDDFYNNDDQRAAQAQYPIGYNRLHNGFGLNVDENGLVLDGIFKEKYLDRNACLGNEQFRKMTKTMDGIMTFGAFGITIAMALMMVWLMFKVGDFNPIAMMIILLSLVGSYGILDKIFNYIKYQKILKDVKAYKAILYSVGTKREGKSVVKECSFAILHNERVRIIHEFIPHQAINRKADARNEAGFVGREFMIMASPDTTGY